MFILKGYVTQAPLVINRLFARKVGVVARLAALSVLCLVLNACESTGGINSLGVSQPEVKVDSVKLNKLSFDDASVNVNLGVINNNVFGINLAGFTYRISVDGNQLLSGDQSLKTSVAAQSTSLVEVPVAINYKELMAASKTLGNKNETPYKLDGDVKLNLPILGIISIPVSTKGILPIPKLPDISVENFKINKVGFSGADFQLKMKVANKNNFDLFLNQLQYDIKIDGVSWGNGQLLKPTTLAKGKSGYIEIPFSINYSDIGLSVMNLIKGKQKFNYDVSGNLGLDTSNPALKGITLPFQKAGISNGF